MKPIVEKRCCFPEDVVLKCTWPEGFGSPCRLLQYRLVALIFYLIKRGRPYGIPLFTISHILSYGLKYLPQYPILSYIHKYDLFIISVQIEKKTDTTKLFTLSSGPKIFVDFKFQKFDENWCFFLFLMCILILE